MEGEMTREGKILENQSTAHRKSNKLMARMGISSVGDDLGEMGNSVCTEVIGKGTGREEQFGRKDIWTHRA